MYVNPRDLSLGFDAPQWGSPEKELACGTQWCILVQLGSFPGALPSNPLVLLKPNGIEFFANQSFQLLPLQPRNVMSYMHSIKLVHNKTISICFLRSSSFCLLSDGSALLDREGLPIPYDNRTSIRWTAKHWMKCWHGAISIPFFSVFFNWNWSCIRREKHTLEHPNEPAEAAVAETAAKALVSVDHLPAGEAA